MNWLNRTIEIKFHFEFICLCAYIFWYVFVYQYIYCIYLPKIRRKYWNDNIIWRPRSNMYIIFRLFYGSQENVLFFFFGSIFCRMTESDKIKRFWAGFVGTYSRNENMYHTSEACLHAYSIMSFIETILFRPKSIKRIPTRRISELMQEHSMWMLFCILLMIYSNTIPIFLLCYSTFSARIRRGYQCAMRPFIIGEWKSKLPVHGRT